MYLAGGAWSEYGFLQGVQATQAQDPSPYPGISSNEAWVNNYQAPFNKNILVPAAARGTTDPAGAYAMLAPAFNKIKNDAIAFVASYPASMRSMAQGTIDGWKKDFPLIEGFLNRWAPAAAAPIALPAGAGVDQPTTIFQDQAPAVYGQPGVYGQGPSQGATTYLPAAAPVINVTTAGAPGAASGLMEYLPWIAGAAVVGLLLSNGSRR